MTRDVRLLEVGNPVFVMMFDYERVVIVLQVGSVRYERTKRYRVIALVPKIGVIKKGVFVRKVDVIIHVFALANMFVLGIYVDRVREYPWVSVIGNVPKVVKFGVRDGDLCKRSGVIRCARDKGGS